MLTRPDAIVAFLLPSTLRKIHKEQWMPPLWRGTICSRCRKVFHYLQFPQTFKNSRVPLSLTLNRPRSYLQKMRKVQLPFATLFTNPTWRKAQLLLVGTILTPGQRTVAAALRVMGRGDQRDYARYHEVLNRAVWSSRAVARVLLLLLL